MHVSRENKQPHKTGAFQNMKTFTFKTGITGPIADHIKEFMLALLLAARIINRHYTQSAKFANWIDLQENYFIADYFFGDPSNYDGNFSFSLSDGVLIVTAKTAFAEKITACLDKAQGPKKNWQQVLTVIYVTGTAFLEGTLDNDNARERI